MEKSAYFSPDRVYRYSLWRVWDKSKGYAQFIGLNPSTADETIDDPTIRRCMSFAKDWGYGGLCMTNLFAFRATEPKDMKAYHEPIGAKNNQWLLGCAEKAEVVVACWGVHGTHVGRDKEVKSMIPDLCYLSLTKDNHPGHPLYLKKTLVPVKWTM